jgi:hypothetical protein
VSGGRTGRERRTTDHDEREILGEQVSAVSVGVGRERTRQLRGTAFSLTGRRRERPRPRRRPRNDHDHDEREILGEQVSAVSVGRERGT